MKNEIPHSCSHASGIDLNVTTVQDLRSIIVSLRVLCGRWRHRSSVLFIEVHCFSKIDCHDGHHHSLTNFRWSALRYFHPQQTFRLVCPGSSVDNNVPANNRFELCPSGAENICSYQVGDVFHFHKFQLCSSQSSSWFNAMIGLRLLPPRVFR